ncbi:MAG: biopolymer transporter ExbD [Kiritimatiellae bacterium]|nr:biopolymer transporter ExbD [Kiritimatiellia bacterium]
MRFSRKEPPKATSIELTSMLDVIFLLLCFFVTISVFSQWESEISIKLPTAGTAQTPDRMPGEVIVNLTKEGVISVNGVKLSLEDLKSRLSKVAEYYPGQPVIIRADRDTKYDMLIKLVDTCRAADIWNFSLATENK